MPELSRADIRRGMWIVVDQGLASMSELRKEWTIDDYFEACEYLRAKQEKTAQAMAEAKQRSGVPGG